MVAVCFLVDAPGVYTIVNVGGLEPNLLSTEYSEAESFRQSECRRFAQLQKLGKLLC